jgi:serine/threonine-protein kinase
MQAFPIEIAYVLDPDLRRSDAIDTDALDFAAAGFIDDIDAPAAPPPVVDVTTPEVDVDFDDNAGLDTNLVAEPPPYVPRRPLIDLPPLADEMEGDQELVTVPAAAAPITAEGRRPLIDLPPLADELDEGIDDLSPIALASIRGSSATTADSVHEVAPAGLPTAASPTEPRSTPPSRTIQRPPTISTPRPTSTPVVPRVAVDEPVTAERAAIDDLAAAPASDSRPRLALFAAAGLLAVGLIGLIIWGVSGRDGETASAPATSVAEQPASSSAEPPPTPILVAPSAPPEAVLRLVPIGYPEKSCTPDTGVPSGVGAAVTCGPNTDAGGPRVGRYTLVADLPALQAQFTEITASTRQQICPGNIQSPGPWRHNATPDQVAGQLYCGVRDDGTPIIAWTDDARLLLSVVDSAPGGEVAAFKWWSSHS